MSDVDSTEATHLSLCAGYGGIDLGLRRVLPDVRTVAYVEIEAFAVANLVSKMEAFELDPAPVWTNLKTLPLEVFRDNVSIISGGFPCQPFSAAGKREGDDDPRHLFPYVKNAVRIIQPEWVFLENVEGIISAKLKSDGWADPAGTPVLLHVIRELERVGYQCAWGVFSAAEVGAPHQRKRVFILARRLGDPSSAGLQGQLSPGEPCQEGRKEPDGRAAPTSGVRSNDELAHANERGGHQDSGPGELRASGLEQSPSNRWPSRPGQAQQEWEEPRVIRAVGNAESRQDERGESGHMGEAECGGEGEPAATANPSAELGDADSGRQLQPEGGERERGRRSGDSGEAAELADTKHDGYSSSTRPEGTGRSEQDEGRPKESPSIEQSTGGREQQQVCETRKLADPRHPEPSGRDSEAEGQLRKPRGESTPQDCGGQHTGQAEPVMGGAVDGPPGRLDPTANRVDRLRLLGNGVVPQTAEVAFRTLYEELTR